MTRTVRVVLGLSILFTIVVVNIVEQEFPYPMGAVYLSNRPQVSVVYKLINHAGFRTREEFVNHELTNNGGG